jgi:type VI secretion system protein ImpL
MRFWLWWLASLIGIICLSLIVWFVFPLIQIGETRPLEATWLLLTIIGGIFAIFLTIFIIQFIRRRRRLKALESELAGPPEP